MPDILNSVYVVIATLVIVLPLGVGAAIYLNEYATNKRIAAAIEYTAETLSGIPSIIYGLVGMLFFCEFLKLKTSLIAGALFAGVPIISARWESYGSVLDEGMTSLGYDMFDVKAFEKLLRDAALNPERLIAMRKNCLEAAKEYIPETAMRVLTRELC